MSERFVSYLKENFDTHLQQLSEFLTIPSISSLSEHKEDVRKAANWLKDELIRLGFDHVKLMETEGHPVVYGDWLHQEGKPTVLIYGHYDVQPVDPLHLWETPPFEPSIRDGRIYARGASDDKGQVFMHLKAIESLLETEGKLPVNIKVIFEGEEEIGSPNLPKFIQEHKDLLAADVLVISDTGMIAEDHPTICYGLRGLCGLQIDIKGPKRDLHSGAYGGAVQNPAHALVELLASFHDKNGKILVDGFYDEVLPITEEEKKALQNLHTDEEQIRQELDVPELFGEEGYSFNERTWMRPTLEINGIHSGFTDEGIKTVLPSEASAKITCRLVPNQDPEKILKRLEDHIEKNKPKGVRVKITHFDKGLPFITPINHPAIQAAARACEKVFSVPTSFTRSGGSIPIVADFNSVLELPVVLLGFALSSDNVHSPNENFLLKNFEKGTQTLGYLWHELAQSF